MTVGGILEHEQAFQAIADLGRRQPAVGHAGYDESAEYVPDRLAAAGTTSAVQDFDYELDLLAD